MLVKQFEAATIQNALKMVKDEMGPEAIILSTREVKVPHRSRSRVEVTAGVNNPVFEPQGSRQVRPDHPPQTASSGNSIMNSETSLKDMENDLNQIKEMLLGLTYQSDLSHRIRDRQDLLRLYHYLIQSELDEILARGLIEKVASQQKETGLTPLALLQKNLSSLFKTANPLNGQLKPGRPRLIALVGPCGCGKTTTLAKLAATAHIKNELKVAIISLDTYRLGATEQLQTYAHIMGLPFDAPQDIREFRQSIELFDDKDLILVDTPGRSLSNPEQLKELSSIMNEMEDSIALLVLSATTKDRSLKETIEAVKPFPIAGLVISMTDQTDVYGNIINNLVKFKKPVCYLANGQKVPDDLIPATPARLAALITGSPPNRPGVRSLIYPSVEKEQG